MVQGERDGDTGNTVKDERRAARLEAPVVGGRKGLAETVTSEANEFRRQKRHPCDESEVGENGDRRTGRYGRARCGEGRSQGFRGKLRSAGCACRL